MAAINFPDAPANGDVFTTAGKTWVYTTASTTWALRTNPTAIPDGGVSDGQLAGSITATKITGTALVASTVTTKGDILAATASATVARLAAGTTGYFLKADSDQTTGLVWAAIPSVSILDDVGDVTITAAASGEFLKWNGSVWVNATVSTDVMTSAANAALITMDIGS